MSDAGRDVGYLLASLDDPLRDLPEPRPDGLLWVDEWSAPGVAPARVLATMRTVAEHRGALEVGLWPRPGQDPAPFRSAPRTSSFPMIAPIAPGLTVDPARDYLGSFEHFESLSNRLLRAPSRRSTSVNVLQHASLGLLASGRSRRLLDKL